MISFRTEWQAACRPGSPATTRHSRNAGGRGRHAVRGSVRKENPARGREDSVRKEIPGVGERGGRGARGGRGPARGLRWDGGADKRNMYARD
ncbi:hypothetical protein GCM10027406_29090 [Leifsonia lichenia]